MGLASVEISGVLWQDIMTIGWEAGSDRIVKCTEGLPEDAVCKSVFYRQWPAISGLTPAPTPSLVFVFEHEDFDDVEPGAPIPMVSIVHQRYRG
jgi:hypothetical protein